MTDKEKQEVVASMNSMAWDGPILGRERIVWHRGMRAYFWRGKWRPYAPADDGLEWSGK